MIRLINAKMLYNLDFLAFLILFIGASSSYKKAKEAEQKTLSASSHNWNALFLGQNAVADVMASKMNTAKSNILDAESSKSVAVRMALGETEIVSDTREFLESHGVILDVFGQVCSLCIYSDFNYRKF